MNSSKTIIWLKDADLLHFNKLKMYVGVDTYERRNLSAYVQPCVSSAMADIISETSDFREFRPVQSNHGELNYIYKSGEKTVFIVCSSYYNPDEFERDFLENRPNLTIFVTHPDGISRQKVTQFAKKNDISLLTIKIPEIITKSEALRKKSADYENKFSAEKSEDITRLDSFLCDSYETKGRFFKFMKKHEEEIMYAAKFVGSLLRGWFGGCPLLDMFK